MLPGPVALAGFSPGLGDLHPSSGLYVRNVTIDAGKALRR